MVPEQSRPYDIYPAGSLTGSVPDPVSDQKLKGGWKEIIGLAIGLGVVLLAALGGVPLPASDSLAPSPSA
jgi:hypothetical protein